MQQSIVHSLPTEPKKFGFMIDGKVHQQENREFFIRHSPGHGVPVSQVYVCTKEDVDRAVQTARNAFEDGRWSRLSGADRAAVLLKAADIIQDRQEELAYWETLENGKPISQSRGEVGACADMFRYAAGVARSLHGDSYNNLGDAMFGLVTREPVGVVGIITPWNFPFLILCERVPYVLAAGCTMVVKPSEVTSVTTLLLAEIMHQAGLVNGVMNVITGPGKSVGQALLDHMDVDMVSFTGSTTIGRQCIQSSAESNIKRLGLELGGKNPQIVFADADIEDAVDGVAFGIGFNTGQCCVSGSRLLVERSIAQTFTLQLVEKLASVKVGDPLDEATQIGAITTDAQNATILGYIEKGKQQGAKLELGGERLSINEGRYITPTIFSEVTSDMTIAKEEIFGPVLVIMPFDTVEEAIVLANDTEYGLAASLWTKNIDKALQVTRRVKAGRFWVNTTLSGGPELPLGGFKQSGWGREAGMYGVEEYTQVKSVHIALGKRTSVY